MISGEDLDPDNEESLDQRPRLSIITRSGRYRARTYDPQRVELVL